MHRWQDPAGEANPVALFVDTAVADSGLPRTTNLSCGHFLLLVQPLIRSYGWAQVFSGAGVPGVPSGPGILYGTMPPATPTLAPGARVEVRDEQWVVRKVTKANPGGQNARIAYACEDRQEGRGRRR